MSRNRIAPAVGQLWKIHGVTYRIESLDGTEGPHWPIVMREVSRDRSVNDDIEAQIAALNPVHRELSSLHGLREPRSMNVELRWFDVRTDPSTPADERCLRVADCGDSGCRYAARPLRGMRTQGGKCRCDTSPPV